MLPTQTPSSYLLFQFLLTHIISCRRVVLCYVFQEQPNKDIQMVRGLMMEQDLDEGCWMLDAGRYCWMDCHGEATFHDKSFVHAFQTLARAKDKGRRTRS